MYAVIETGGKQYKVSEGDIIFIEKLEVDPGENYVFDKVISIIDGDNSAFGSPTVDGASVEAIVVSNGKSKKIRIFKFKAKKGYRRHQGHRQPYTKVEIKKITA